jgi:hypothetical protein
LNGRLLQAILGADLPITCCTWQEDPQPHTHRKADPLTLELPLTCKADRETNVLLDGFLAQMDAKEASHNKLEAGYLF